SEKLLSESQGLGSKRQANAQFLHASRGAGEEKVGQVGADDEQDHAASTHQDGNWSEQNRLRSVMRLPHRENSRANTLVAVCIQNGHAVGEGLHFTVCLFDGRAWSQPRHQNEVAGVAIAQHPGAGMSQLTIHGERHPEFIGEAGTRAMKTFWSDSDDGERRAVDAKRCAYGRDARAKGGTPVFVADDYHRVSVLSVIAFFI